MLNDVRKLCLKGNNHIVKKNTRIMNLPLIGIQSFAINAVYDGIVIKISTTLKSTSHQLLFVVRVVLLSVNCAPVCA
jgi:hypothetical protein